MIFVNDAAGQTLYQDPVWTDLTGQTIAQALGRGWLERVHRDDRGLVEDTHLGAVASEAEFCMQYRVLAPDDRPRWVLVGAQASLGPPGRTFIGYLGSLILQPDAPAGTYRAYGRIARDTVHRADGRPASSADDALNAARAVEDEFRDGPPSLRQRIQSAIGLGRLARRHVGGDGAFRTRLVLDMALVELAKEMARLNNP